MIRIFILFLLLAVISCAPDKPNQNQSSDSTNKTEMAFDKDKWSFEENSEYPYRERMMNDILYNKILHVLKRDTILSLLGEPSYYRQDSNYLHYTISQTRILDSWTIFVKTLVIKTDSSGTVDWVKLHE